MILYFPAFNRPHLPIVSGSPSDSLVTTHRSGVPTHLSSAVLSHRLRPTPSSPPPKPHSPSPSAPHADIGQLAAAPATPVRHYSTCCLQHNHHAAAATAAASSTVTSTAATAREASSRCHIHGRNLAAEE